MHNDQMVMENEAKNPEIIMFYNETNGGVDCLDMLVHNYMSKRQTRRWPMCFFHNFDDVCGVASIIIWTYLYPMWKVTKQSRRKIFLKCLGEQLVDAEIKRPAESG